MGCMVGWGAGVMSGVNGGWGMSHGGYRVRMGRGAESKSKSKVRRDL